MKNAQTKMLLCFLGGLLLMVLTAWLLAGPIALGEAPVGMLLAVGVLILAVVVQLLAQGTIFKELLCFQAKRRLFYASYFLNAVASGCAVGSVLIGKDIAIGLELHLAILPAAALGLLLWGLYFIPGDGLHKAFSIIFVVLAVGLCAAAVWVWICISATVGCMALFGGLYFLLLPVGMLYAARNPGDWSRYLSYTGFGTFAVVFFAALLILSDGDFLDILDFGGGEGGTRKKKPRK